MTAPDLRHLAAIIESSNDGIIGETLQGIITAWNPAAERLFGYTAAEIIGRSIETLFPPERLAAERLLLRRIAAGERVEHYDTVRIRKDGTPVSVSLTLSPIRDDNGQVIGASKIARDLTDPQRAAARLVEQERLLDVTLATIGEAVICVNEQGRITFMNQVAERLTGWSAEEARGAAIETVMCLVDEHTRARLDPSSVTALRERATHSLGQGALLLSRDGVERPISDVAAPLFDEERRVLGVVTVFFDFAEQRRAEHDLLRLAAIVESSDDAIVSKTLQGIITSWNPGAARIFGYTAEEAIGQPITMLFPPDRLGEEAAFMEQIGRGQRIEHFETTRVRKDGGYIDISVTLSPIKNASGRVIGVSKIARDVTERKRIDASRAELLQREQDARHASEEAHRLKDEFLATLSHELRTPVNAIMGWARIIRARQVDPDSFTRGLEVIERNARLQVDLVSDLLDMSRIVTGRMRLAVSVIDAVSVLKQAVDSVRPAALAKDLTLDLRLPDVATPVWADANRLQQVCWNLLINAVKFTPPHGRIEASLTMQGPSLEVRVKDTGMGIAPNLLPHVFDRFRQGDSSTTRQQSGLGLGLAIVRNLVELHGGTVHVSSPGEGQGATFMVRLPSANVWTPAGTPPPEIPSTALTGVRVLVVDDEADARELVAQVLQTAGAEVVAVGSAPEAIEAFRYQEFHAIIADLAMPGMDGFTMMRELRTIEQGRGTHAPAVALTALAHARDRQQALAAGFERHIAKPVDPLSLPEIIADLLSSSSLSGA